MRNALLIAAAVLTLARPGLAAQGGGPEAPLGLSGVHYPGFRAFTVLWDPVTRAVTGEPLAPAGYNIYRRESLRGPATRINPYPAPICAWADRNDGRAYFYSVRAVDANGVESADSFTVVSTPETQLIYLPDDGLSSVVIPRRVADQLRPGRNTYGVPLTFRLVDGDGHGRDGVVRDVTLKVLRVDTMEEVKGPAFSGAGVEIRFGYGLAGGRLTAGAPGAANAPPLAMADATPDQLCLYWSNGVEWIKVGGRLNPGTQTIDIKSSQAGNYQLRVAPRAGSLALAKASVFPGLFTPNGDGFNDRVYFVLENPNNAGVKADIFDLEGRHVITLPGPVQTGGVGTTLAWSGVDANGSVVAGGLYVYRIEGESQVITGTVSVAR